MRATRVQSLLSLYGAGSAARAEAIATELRSVGELPKGGRGPNAPHLNQYEIALFALAVAGAERIADATTAASILGDLVDENRVTLLRVLADAINQVGVANSIRNIRVLREGEASFAEVAYWREGREAYDTKYFMPADRWELRVMPQAQFAGYVGRIGHIGGGVLSQLALEFAEPGALGGSSE